MLESAYVKRVMLATLVCVVFAAVASVFRPYWRDEYWTLFFSEPRISWTELFSDRINRDTHPPLYFAVIRLVRTLLDDPLLLRAVNFVFLGGMAVAALWAGRRRPVETLLFVTLCLCSYWAVFFLVEARAYALLYGAAILSVVLMRALLEDEEFSLSLLAIWAANGALMGMLHYYGGVWIACAGLALGVAWLFKRRFDRFVLVGIASVIAFAPMAAWILYVSNTATLPEAAASTPLGRLVEGLEQYLRGLVVKTWGSNLALMVLAFLGAGALARNARAADGAIFWAAAGLTLLSFAFQIGWLPVIKERAFIVIMPAVVYVMARAAMEAKPTKLVGRLTVAVPFLAAFSPFLFWGEHFKDRERLAEVAEVYREAGACEGAPVLAYIRTFQHRDYYVLFTERGLSPDGGGPLLVDSTAPGVVAPEFSPRCRLRAVAIGLARGGDDIRAEARASFEAAGLDLEALDVRLPAEGRHIMVLAPAE